MPHYVFDEALDGLTTPVADEQCGNGVAARHRVAVPLFAGTVHFFTDRAQFMRFYDSFGGSSKLEDDATGGYASADGTDGIVHMLGVFNGARSTLVHELGHCCMRICEHAGFEPNEARGEPFCYLLAGLFPEFESLLIDQSEAR